jgi:hypothetical protein
MSQIWRPPLPADPADTHLVAPLAEVAGTSSTTGSFVLPNILVMPASKWAWAIVRRGSQ